MADTQSLEAQDLSFSLSPRTMQMLGRQNVSSPVIALLELVKNAYDADATTVKITMRRASTSEGIIVIEDDGTGMSQEDVAKKWMRISTDNKLQISTTKKLHRVKVGEKGIGRLSLDRLAATCDLITHISRKSGLHLHIDWTKYETTTGEIQKITHPCLNASQARGGRSGTVIYLSGLRDQWSRDEYDLLYTDLALLIPPFLHRQRDRFSIILDCDEAPDISGPITSSVAKVAEYRLESRLTADGRIVHRLRHRSGKVSTYDRNWAHALNLPDKSAPTCGPVRFTLYWYLRDKETLKDAGIKLSELRKFLEEFQGVRIYRDGVRVKPYGDPLTKEDWLGLNARRVRHPGGAKSLKSGSWVIAGNQVVGAIYITRDDNPQLTDQANREGIARNRAYLDLRRFIFSGIQFLESERADALRKSPPSEQKPDSQTTVGVIQEELQTSIEELRQAVQEIKGDMFAQQHSPAVEEVLSRVEIVARETEILAAAHAEEQTENQLLIGLATLGIAMATFGHETIGAIASVLNNAKLLHLDIEQLQDGDIKQNAQTNLENLLIAMRRVEMWGRFALDRVRSDKRKRKEVDLVKEVVEPVLQAFSGTLARRNITPNPDFQNDLPKLRAFPMDIEAIVINLITNAVEALKHVDDRNIYIGVKYLAPTQQFQIKFADNGRGIHEQDLPKVFDPMFTTKLTPEGEPEGTGLGLTIINSIVEEYDGKINVQGHGSLGGAEFEILIPRRYLPEE